MNIAEIRQKYPQYNDLSDQELADSLHRKFYADMPPAEFYQKVGLQVEPQQEPRSRTQEFGRQLGLTGRALVEGVADLASPFANPVAVMGNAAIAGAERLGLNEPGGFRFPEQSGAVSGALTNAGVPAPETGIERGVNFTGRLATAMATGPRLDRAVTARMPQAPAGAAPSPPSLGNLSQQFDVPLTAGEATQSPFMQRLDTYLERLPFIGIRGFRERQQAAIKGAANKLVNEAGESVDDAGEAIRSSLNRVYQSSRGTASKLFDRVDEAASGANIQVYGQNRQRAAAEILQEQARLARQKAADPAVEKAARDTLEGLPMSFGDARKLRSVKLTDIRAAERGEISGSVKPTTVAALKRLEQALEADMEEWAVAHGGGVLSKWRNANHYYTTRVVPFKDRTIRKVSDDSFDPDAIIRTFIRPDSRGTASKLVNRLDLKGKEAVRYGVLRQAFDDAQDSSGFFSPQSFRNSVERLGKTRQRVFTPQQETQIEGFARLAEAAKRAGQFRENPPTGARLMDVAMGGGGVALYGASGPAGMLAGAAGVKTLSVLMTTQRGRALLSRAAQYAPDSPQMANAMRAAIIEVNRVIQEDDE